MYNLVYLNDGGDLITVHLKDGDVFTFNESHCIVHFVKNDPFDPINHDLINVTSVPPFNPSEILFLNNKIVSANTEFQKIGRSILLQTEE